MDRSYALFRMLARLKLFLILVSLVSIVGIGLWQKTRVVEFLAFYHLLPEPEPLTELYFEDHLKLPKKLESGKNQSFTFTIHNIEYREVEYRWEVVAETEIEKTEDRGQNTEGVGQIATGEELVLTPTAVPLDIVSELLASGTARLAHDEYFTATESYSLRSSWPHERTKVRVAIVEKLPLTELHIARLFDTSEQRIHFWLEK